MNKTWRTYKISLVLIFFFILILGTGYYIFSMLDFNQAGVESSGMTADCRTFLIKSSNDVAEDLKILLPVKITRTEHQSKVRLLNGPTIVVEELDAVIDMDVVNVSIHPAPLTFDTVELLLVNNSYQKIYVGKHTIELLPEGISDFAAKDTWYATDSYTKTDVNHVVGSFTFKTGIKATPEIILPEQLLQEGLNVTVTFEEKQRSGDKVEYAFEITTKKSSTESYDYRMILFDVYIVYRDFTSEKIGFLMKVNIPLDIQ